MKVCVLGAGVVGLTTAWALAEAGCDVAVIDRRAAAGLEASRGNGAQLSYAFVSPLASPETLRHIPALLLQPQGPLRVRPGLDAGFLRWGAAFLRACRADAVRETVAAQLLLAALSRAELAAMQARLAAPVRLARRRQARRPPQPRRLRRRPRPGPVRNGRRTARPDGARVPGPRTRPSASPPTPSPAASTPPANRSATAARSVTAWPPPSVPATASPCTWATPPLR